MEEERTGIASHLQGAKTPTPPCEARFELQEANAVRKGCCISQTKQRMPHRQIYFRYTEVLAPAENRRVPGVKLLYLRVASARAPLSLLR